MSSTTDISSIFADEKYLIQPSTIEYIQDLDGEDAELAKAIVSELDSDVSTVTSDEIDTALENITVGEDKNSTESNANTEATTDNQKTEKQPLSQNETEDENSSTSETTDETSKSTNKDTSNEHSTTTNSIEDESQEVDEVTDEKLEQTEESGSETGTESDSDTPESVNPNPTSERDEDMYAGATPEDVYEGVEETEVTLEDIDVTAPDTEAEPRSGKASVEVVKDIDGKSTGTGEFKDFASLFTDRYEKLKDILTQRFSPVPIKALEDSGGKAVSIIGRVTEVRTTQNNNRLVILEDRTGEFPIVFTDEREQEITEELLEGEVIGVEGEVAGNGEILFGNGIMLPEVPPRNSPNKADRPVKAAFVSDIHLGADTFASECWSNFVDWIQDKDEIEYLFVAGDVIEGIGVYPGQEDILTVIDMYDQYDLCGEAFKQLPDDLEIIICTGNHDMVRLAEPQPPLPDKFTRNFPDNVTFTGNPATVKIEEDILVEFYHGMSINGFTDTIPSADVMNPTTAMKHMLKKRHLAPLYGYNTRIAPEKEDYLVLERIPDILHSGHVHTFGTDDYNGVTMLNTGAWQYQTDFQEKMNIVPTVANVAVVDLETQTVDVKDFNR